MTDEPDRFDPFAILGVGHEAGDQEVRRAYAVAIRAARVAGDTECVARVQRAFEAIRDAAGREQARSVVSRRDELEPLFTQAREAMEKGEPETALAHVRSILDVSPDLETALEMAVQLEMALDRIDDAVFHAGLLADAAPSSFRRADMLSRMFATQAELTRDTESRLRLFEKALTVAQRARDLGQDSARSAILESQLLWNLERRKEARSVLVKALRDTSELKSAELALYLALLRVDAMSSNLGRLSNTLEHLRGRLPESDERRLSIAKALCEFVVELLPVVPIAALRCAELAALCTPDEPYPAHLVEAAHAAMEHQAAIDAEKQAAEEAAKRREERRRQRARANRKRAYERPRSSSGWFGKIAVVWIALVLIGGVLRGLNKPGSSRRSPNTSAGRRYSPSDFRTPGSPVYDPSTSRRTGFSPRTGFQDPTDPFRTPGSPVYDPSTSRRTGSTDPTRRFSQPPGPGVNRPGVRSRFPGGYDPRTSMPRTRGATTPTFGGGTGSRYGPGTRRSGSSPFEGDSSSFGRPR